ncbi:hypothetical protein AUEXF2481DRAFT_81948 [Aureobasidium subglaciale EXF-2481]|uniref:Ecp2 effector protein domain-containing protein n=1 Tax=Aureobasidium subglaciale (strain EXF-2481) TaxID=1043005 RepID=A0A074YAB2_AURSE|nr:uncharacterized protein AUEXF2481DRAFT_81948 [Aureobasidium subglaciale EXF-2481]KEQ92924.1 hypothetical protein AUEXF2481DRAFT_81948 [Aureobasidium subglaciale EXF-2481]
MRASTLSLFISLVVSVHGLLALRPGVNVSQYVQPQAALSVRKMWSAPTAIRLVHKDIRSLRAPGQLISVGESVHTIPTTSSVASTPTSTATASLNQIMCAIGFNFNAGTRASSPPNNTTMAIEDFCANEIARDKFKDTTTYPQRSYLSSDVTISIMAIFADTVGMSGLAGCGQDVEFVVKDRESVCRGMLQQIVQECVHEVVQGKTGGFAIESSAEYGCVIWQIWGYE